MRTARLATAADLPALVTLERLASAHPWTETQLRDELERPHGRVHVVDAADAPVAMVVGWWLLDQWHILNVATHPGHRRRGMARALLVDVAGRALDAGMTEALLEVRAGNTGALALYTSLGFTRTGLRRRYYGGTEDAVLMNAPTWRVAGGPRAPA